ncbi:MAG: V-type ATP synthase subunit E family protein, partial [Candidatus Thorarchaeota archaeon]
KKYADVLAGLAVDGGVSLNIAKIELIFPSGQKTNLTPASISKKISEQTGQKTTVTLSKETVRSIGGVLIRSDDGAKWVDNTFEARLERLDNKIRDVISRMLFGSTE